MRQIFDTFKYLHSIRLDFRLGTGKAWNNYRHLTVPGRIISISDIEQRRLFIIAHTWSVDLVLENLSFITDSADLRRGYFQGIANVHNN